MSIYNKLSSNYDKLYRLNIEQFQANLESVWGGDEWFVDFYPSLGIKSSEVCELLFYGQAVNGWESGFDLHENVTTKKIENSVLCSNKYLSELNHTPLDWVNARWSNSTFDSICDNASAKLFYASGGNYRTYRSFFWKVTSKLACDYYGLSRNSWDWAKKINWSNLYKIAEDGRNPTELIRNSQLQGSIELIKQEIEELRPKYCIILSNYSWWKPFKDNLQTRAITYDKRLTEIVSFEQYNNTKLIVTTRPWVGSGESHVAQILQLINQLYALWRISYTFLRLNHQHPLG